MEFYNFGKEHKFEDALIPNQETQHFEYINQPDVLTQLLESEPEKLGLAVIKHPRINNYDLIINLIKVHRPKLELIYSNKTTLTEETVNALYPDLLTDGTMIHLLTTFFGSLDSVLLVFKGSDNETQNSLNSLKKIYENGSERPGVIRREVEIVKYSQKVFELWKQRFFKTNSAYLLARCYLLGRGVHMPDSNSEAVNLLHRYIKTII